MLTKKLVTLNKLISFVSSFNDNVIIDDGLDKIFSSQIKSNDEFKFDTLKYGDNKTINDFPEKLKSIFEPFIKDLTRFGIRQIYDKNNINLSLYSSVLTLLINSYHDLSQIDQLNYITKIRDKLVIYVTNPTIMKNNGYVDFGWVKKDITSSLVQFKTNKMILKLIADYFSINIFLINIVEDKIYVISEKNYYNLFRQSIFLVLNNDSFEPLIYNENKLSGSSIPTKSDEYNHGAYSITSGPIKKLVMVDKNSLTLMELNFNDNKKVQFNVQLEDLLIYDKTIENDTTKIFVNDVDLKVQPTIDNNVMENLAHVDPIFNVCAINEIENGYSEVIQNDSDGNYDIKDIETRNKTNNIALDTGNTKLIFKLSPKMKLDEIQEIATKLNIILEKDNKTNSKKIAKTKVELIDEIKLIVH